MADGETNTTVAEYQELQKLLEKKKLELMKKADNKDNRQVDYVGDNKVEEILGPRFFKDNSQKSNKRTEYADSTASSSTIRQTSSTTRKQRKNKSYFPVTAQAENRGKSNTHYDLINLTRIVCENKDHESLDDSDFVNEGNKTRESEKNKTEVHSTDTNNFGLYTNRRAAFRCLKREVNLPDKQLYSSVDLPGVVNIQQNPCIFNVYLQLYYL
ncbi:hypothetical protein LOTGIDRAFT_165026 [Lottia gigantea]|uniref:Uncharacterized protein n=1 Tax=Lottia gigantea TaxID=225164 RepID=V4BLD1_LOTGI|nr:hypothetical protein LOTGIDRAFT_165026 [Lottia gigantea]ESO89429.1 hypothetical protein LOTGIDRAFT_165026 [Lottia gigantea]